MKRFTGKSPKATHQTVFFFYWFRFLQYFFSVLFVQIWQKIFFLIFNLLFTTKWILQKYNTIIFSGICTNLAQVIKNTILVTCLLASCRVGDLPADQWNIANKAIFFLCWSNQKKLDIPCGIYNSLLRKSANSIQIHFLSFQENQTPWMPSVLFLVKERVTFEWKDWVWVQDPSNNLGFTVLFFWWLLHCNALRTYKVRPLRIWPVRL